MNTRYDIRPEFNSWTVYDTITGGPASINNVPQTLFRSTRMIWLTC